MIWYKHKSEIQVYGGWGSWSLGAWKNGDTKEAIWLKGGRRGSPIKMSKRKSKNHIHTISWSQVFLVERKKEELWGMVQSRVYISHKDTRTNLFVPTLSSLFFSFLFFLFLSPKCFVMNKKSLLILSMFLSKNNCIF